MEACRRLLLVSLVGVFLLACSVPGSEAAEGLEIGSTAAPGSPPPPPPTASSTPGPQATVLPEGSYRFPAGDAGVVTIRLAGSSVALERVEPASGWAYHPERSDVEGGDIEVQLEGPDGARLAFAAERDDDGTLETRVVESVQAADGQSTVASGDAGSVTFTVAGEWLRVDDARADNQAGWHIVEDELEDEGFLIALANAGRSTGIRLSGELDDGGRLELETVTRTGPGYRTGLRDDAPEPSPTGTPRPPVARPTPTDDDDDDGDGDDDGRDDPPTRDTAETPETRETPRTMDTRDTVETAETVESGR